MMMMMIYIIEASQNCFCDLIFIIYFGYFGIRMAGY